MQKPLNMAQIKLIDKFHEKLKELNLTVDHVALHTNIDTTRLFHFAEYKSFLRAVDIVEIAEYFDCEIASVNNQITFKEKK